MLLRNQLQQEEKTSRKEETGKGKKLDNFYFGNSINYKQFLCMLGYFVRIEKNFVGIRYFREKRTVF